MPDVPTQSRTVFAQQAVDFAQLFAMSFADPIVSSKTKLVYSVQMSAPEGLSTGGGVQGVQHITLVPHGGGNPPIVIGQTNKAAGTAELRSFTLLQAYHDRRNPGVPIPLDGTAYEGLVERMHTFLSTQGMKVKRADVTTPSMAGIPAQRPAAGPPWGLVIGIAVAVLALGLGLGLFLGRAH